MNMWKHQKSSTQQYSSGKCWSNIDNKKWRAPTHPKNKYVGVCVYELSILTKYMHGELIHNCCFLWQHMDGSYCVKPLKQKQVVSTPAFLLSLPSSFCVTFVLCFWKTKIHQSFISPLEHDAWPMRPAAFLLHYVLFSQVDGVSYLLQEIYGIENKYNSQESKVNIRRHASFFCLLLFECVRSDMAVLTVCL